MISAWLTGDPECKVFFTTQRIGRLNNEPLLSELAVRADSPTVVIIRGNAGQFVAYRDVIKSGVRFSSRRLQEAQMKVLPYNVCNLQFTSGTTGRPKAAMLTHQ